MPIEHQFVITLACPDAKGMLPAVLARAVRRHPERRVVIDGHPCVVFR